MAYHLSYLPIVVTAMSYYYFGHTLQFRLELK